MKTVLLRITEAPDAGGYSVAMFDADASGGWSAAPLAEDVVPATIAPWDPVVQAVCGGPPVQIEDAARAAEPSGPTAVGQLLFAAIMQGRVGAAWKALQARHPAERPNVSEALRTLLEVGPPVLRALPWETLHEPPPSGRPLFRLPHTPWARWVAPPPNVPAALDVCWPLRVMVVIGCAEDDRAVEWEAELHAVRVACNRLRHAVDLLVLHRPGGDELRRKYGEFLPHVFHFIGHGTDPGADLPSALKILKPDGIPRLWTAQEIGADLAGWTPRLVILNACDAATPTQRQGTWTLTDTFLALGTQVMVAMQGKVEGRVAATFAAVLYKQLEKHVPLDQAAAEGRAAAASLDGVGAGSWQWTLPLIAFTVPPDEALPPVGPHRDDERWKHIQRTREFRDIEDFVDRREERRTLTRGIAPPPETGGRPRHLLIIRGQARVGKTALALWCLEECAHRGETVAYVDLRSPQSLGFLDVLRLVRDGPDRRGIRRPDNVSHAQCLVCRPLPEAAFSRFNEQLNHWLKGAVPPSPQAQAVPVPDAGLELQPGAENLIPDIFAAYRAALVQAAAPAGLTIVLDHLSVGGGGVSPGHYELLREHLIEHVADGSLHPVRLVLVLTDDANAPEVGTLLGQAVEITVPLFRRDEWVPVAVDHFYLTADEEDCKQDLAFVKEAMGYLERLYIKKPVWKPARLRNPASRDE